MLFLPLSKNKVAAAVALQTQKITFSDLSLLLYRSASNVSNYTTDLMAPALPV